jgi:hypothetical protein
MKSIAQFTPVSTCEQVDRAVATSVYNHSAERKRAGLGISLESERERKLTGRRVDDEVVEVAPSHLGEKLSDHAVLLRTPPDDAVASVLEKESDAHETEPSTLIDVDGDPS